MSAPIPSGAAKVQRGCMDCCKPLGPKNRSGRCRSCVLRHQNADPEFQAARYRGLGFEQPRQRGSCGTCGATLGLKNRSGFCLPCFNRDPACAERRGKGVSEYMNRRLAEDPDFAARYREKGRVMGLSGLGNAAAPAGSEPRRRMGETQSRKYLPWCPPEYRPVYRRFLRNLKLGPVEAKRRTLRQIETDKCARLAATRLDAAIFHLRRLTPVYETEGGYRYGTVILTPEQLVERALQKGWQP